jgi:hypothetical protein
MVAQRIIVPDPDIDVIRVTHSPKALSSSNGQLLKR